MTPAQIVYCGGVLAKMVETTAWKKDPDRNDVEPLFLTSKAAQAYLKNAVRRVETGID